MLGMVGGVLSMGLGSACMSWVASAAGAERSVTITTGSGASCGRRRMSDRWSILVAQVLSQPILRRLMGKCCRCIVRDERDVKITAKVWRLESEMTMCVWGE